MNIKMKMIACGLISYMSIATAYENGEEIHDNHDNTRIFNNIAINVSGRQVTIYAISTKISNHPTNFSEVLRPATQTIDRTLWTITSDQLPLTLNDCMDLDLIICEKETYCYKNCLSDIGPEIIAFDSKNKKVFLNYGSMDIGTGGGPSLLFVADINKRKMTLLKRAGWEEKGSVSPSSRYLVLHDASVISVYDTETNTWFDINQSENDYSGKRYIIHDLDLKKWISDTQFTYIDSSRYFTRPVDEQPFINAKEVTYDITTKTRFSEKAVSENEYEKFIKNMQNNG